MEKPFQPKAMLISCIRIKMDEVLKQVMAIVCVFFLLTETPLLAQKKWDGEGGDSLWNNPTNWSPDGVPGNTDDVLIDNEFVPASFSVVFPEGASSIQIQSLRIKATANRQILVLIPPNNTASPALSISASDTAICIGNGTIFTNASTAVAGNPIVLNGLFTIENGGRYIHQTLRGNALLVSRLATGMQCHKGIFEFDVPGNSAYTISGSGRQFGTLQFNGRGTTRKTYSCSGNGRLRMDGDLIIHEQAAFISSLINNISLGGNLLVRGRLYINPVSGDTTGRNFEMDGESQEIEVTGQFNQGIHFRQWILKGNAIRLKSNVSIEQVQSSILVSSDCEMDFSTYSVKGAGQFIADSAANLLLAAPVAVATDSGTENINTLQTHFHPKVRFHFYGTNEQATGRLFPLSIGMLTLNKTNGDLQLSTGLHISDTLMLTRGKIIVADTIRLEVSGYTSFGNENSFVDGPFTQLSNLETLHFPIGKGNVYAPVQIERPLSINSFYTIRCVEKNYPNLNKPLAYPLANINETIFWDVKKSINNDSFLQQERLTLVKTNSNTILENVFSCIVYLDSLTNQWQVVSSIPSDTTKQTLSTNSVKFSAGLYTTGKVLPAVLPLEHIALSSREYKDSMELKWTVNDDANAEQYMLEVSKDGRAFHEIARVPSSRTLGKTSYIKRLATHSILNTYIRIRGIDQNGFAHFSNIIFKRRRQTNSRLYPNPSKNYLYLETKYDPLEMHIVSLDGSTVKMDFENRSNVYRINISRLLSGKYILWIRFVDAIEQLAFIKV